MVGWPAVRLSVCLADEMQVNFEFLNFLLCLTKLQHYYSNMNAFKLVFSAKACFKVVIRSVKTGEAIVFLVNPYY